MYDYHKALKTDIRDYIEDNINLADFTDAGELADQLNNDLWTADSVTGNASGSYTFNRNTARGFVLDNIDLIPEMCWALGITTEEIGEHFLNEDWEWFDVSIRCALLGQCIDEVTDELIDVFSNCEEE